MKELTDTEKIRAIMKQERISLTMLSEQLGTTKQNLYNKLKRGDLRQSELIAIAKVLGAKYDSLFILSDGSEV